MSFSFFVFYNIIRVPLFILAKIAGLFNAKIRSTLHGRHGLWADIDKNLRAIPDGAPRVWIHASSMGEYEQAMPLLKELLARDSSLWIVLTLFSPSVFKHVKESIERTVLTYLPFDSSGNVKRFLAAAKPSASVIVRHDIWPNYQWHLQKRNIPSILIAASISDKRLASTKRLSGYYKQVFSTFSAICAVSEQHAERIKMVYSQPEKIYVCGDTRYDRVRERALDKSKILNLIDSKLFAKQRCLVVGSSWPEDEKVIFPAISKALKLYSDFSLVLAPHELTADHLTSIEDYFTKEGIDLVRWSRFEGDSGKSIRVLLVDTIGLLANMYALGSLAYVGGAFGLGVHSVLEPAAHGVWICFGPGHLNSHEASDMASKVSVPISTAKEFEQFLMPALKNPQQTARHGKMTLDYIQANFGASSKTANVIEKFIQ